jgi:hypothetical protein
LDSRCPGPARLPYAAFVDDDVDEPIPTVAKPDELLALHDVTEELFTTLRRWFAVPPSVAIDLADIDSAVGELGDPLMIAALAMRKLQALHLLATPGVMTTTDVVITIVQDLDRALVQAPNMHLKLRAAATDWDAAFAELDAGGFDAGGFDRAEPDLVPGEAEHPIAETFDSFMGDVPAPGPTGDDPAAAGDDFMDELAVIRHDHPSRRPEPGVPLDPSQADPETDRFRALHAKLHEAVFAVIEVSDNEIRYLI